VRENVIGGNHGDLRIGARARGPAEAARSPGRMDSYCRRR
jgi:hypothetical protein